MTDISEVFTELFFGTGAWLGLLLLITIIVALSLTTKWLSVLTLPITVFLAIDYITNELYWNALIMLFTAIFIIITVSRDRYS